MLLAGRNPKNDLVLESNARELHYKDCAIVTLTRLENRLLDYLVLNVVDFNLAVKCFIEEFGCRACINHFHPDENLNQVMGIFGYPDAPEFVHYADVFKTAGYNSV